MSDSDPPLAYEALHKNICYPTFAVSVIVPRSSVVTWIISMIITPFFKKWNEKFFVQNNFRKRNETLLLKEATSYFTWININVIQLIN